MAYATKDDIITLYSTDALYVADRDGDGIVDDAAVDRALVSAQGEIDSYLAVRETLPLPSTPDILVQLSVDIALYRLAASSDVLSEEHRTRYEDATAHLKRLSKGDAVLVFAIDENAVPDPDQDNSPNPIVVAGPPRVFSREKMEGL